MAKLTEEEKARRARNRRRKPALRAEEAAIRREEKRREWEENGTRLTLAELQAGIPCRACGLPIIDGLGEWPGLLDMDDKQREEYDAAQADFKKRHPDCGTTQDLNLRWSVQGSRTMHCGVCCPPPPLGEEQAKAIAKVLAGVLQQDPGGLASWKLTLTCDHVIEQTQHRSHDRWSLRVAKCPECQQTRGVVTSERIPSEEPATRDAREDAQQRRTTESLAKARAEHERLQKKAESALRRVNQLERQLADPEKHQ